jgi:hypothetical protein
MNRRKRLTFWGADENDDSLPRAVIAGRKTVTADTVEEAWFKKGPFWVTLTVGILPGNGHALCEAGVQR